MKAWRCKPLVDEGVLVINHNPLRCRERHGDGCGLRPELKESRVHGAYRETTGRYLPCIAEPVVIIPAAEYEKMEDVIKMLEHACGGAAQGYPAAEEAQVALAALARLRALGKG